MNELDIWRTAKVLIDAHGEGAEIEAAMRADLAIDQGNAAVENIWKRVLRAIQELPQQKPSGDVSLH